MTRLPRATRAEFPEELYYVYDRLPNGPDGTPMNIFAAMGNNPGLLRSYLRLANPLWAQCGLDPERREIVILRTALLHKSVYEWHQHVRIAGFLLNIGVRHRAAAARLVHHHRGR